MKRIIYTLVGMMLSIGCWADNVAKIGETGYETLQEAFDAATAGQSVQLIANVELANWLNINNGKDVTLDLNGYTISPTADHEKINYCIILVHRGAKLTIDDTSSDKNGCIDGGTGDNAYYGGILLTKNDDAGDAAATLVVNNGTIKGEQAAITGNGNRHNTNVTINGGTFTATSTVAGSEGCAIYHPQVGTLTINGGTFTGYASAVEIRSGTLNISGGSFTATATDYSVKANGNGTSTIGSAIAIAQHTTKKDIDVTISGGTFSGVKAVSEANPQGNAEPQISLAVTGGTFTGEISAEDVNKFISGGTFSSAVSEDVCKSGFVPTKKSDGTYGVLEGSYVAQIGDVKYATLAEAVEAATAGQTITLLSDVTISTVDELSIDKALTLDLAGHTITSTVQEPILVKNGGDLTITGNGTITGPTGEAGKALDGRAIITVEGGKLTYLNGTLTCGGVGSDGMYGVYILNGGTAVFGNESDKTGPTITSWFAAIGENNTTAPANITVYGGTYTSQASPSESDWWSYFCAPIYAAGSGEINISGGEFNGYYGLSSRYSNVNQDLNITGGTFTGTKTALFFDNQTGVASSETRDVAVSGGTFSSAVPEEYCADGFIPTDDGHGNYGVKEGSYVAQIGGQGYESLADAVAAATDGQTITLLADVTVDKTILIEKDITIDGDGKTISSTVTSILGTFYVNEPTCTFAIENATIDGKNTASMAVCVYRGKANDTLDATPTVDTENSGNNVTLTDCTVKNFTGWPGSYVGAVYAYSKSHLTLNNCTFTGNTTTLNTNGASGADVWTGAATTVVINGGTYNEVFVNTNSSNVETVTINGGAKIEELAICVSYKNDGSTNIPVLTIDNATVTNLTTEEGNPIPETGITIQNGGSITNMPAFEAAKILNGTKTNAFASLDDAINAANGAGEDITITLLTDATATVELPANVTIDADGKVLTLPTFKVSDGTDLTYAKVINATDGTYKVTTATYNRTGAAGTQWGTVCLPFSIESAPTGYTLYTPSAVSKTELTVTEVSYPVAIGTPVIFYKNTTDEAVITSSNASVKIDATPLAQSGDIHLVGTFSNQKIESGLENIYYINGDQFHQAQASLTVPAYRAYINNTASGAKPRVLSLLVGDADATAIEAVSSSISAATAIYDASGRKLSAPQKGLNIIKLADGKTVKLLIK